MVVHLFIQKMSIRHTTVCLLGCAVLNVTFVHCNLPGQQITH
uniref:Uncharacterized protein n=1 Tax=Anguilla anguilla TaxID=7936 RepID=A0A0E9TWU9_ANGAN